VESRAVRLGGVLAGILIVLSAFWLIGPVRGVKILMGASLAASSGKAVAPAIGVLIATVLGVILPFVAMFMPRRQSNAPRTLIVVAAVACLVVDAFVVRAFDVKDPTRAAEKPPPEGCRILTNDTAAVGKSCEGGCPNAYMCTTASLATDAKTCQIVCTHDCECPTGYKCEASVCGRVR
jgi:hypothetical protein